MGGDGDVASGGGVLHGEAVGRHLDGEFCRVYAGAVEVLLRFSSASRQVVPDIVGA